MKIFIIITALLAGMFSCKTRPMEVNERISIDKIEELYGNMKASGVNTDAIMLYGYFFTNSEPKKLEKVAEELKHKKFDFVDIYQDEDGTYWLHMERKEVHNPQSLFNLNKELYILADKYKIASYDGFDIGNPDKDKAIERNTYAVPEEFKATDIQKDGYPYLLIGNTAFDRFPHKEEFSSFIKVSTKYTTEEESLLPSQEELKELDNFEFFIENNLTQNGIDNYYVFRDTHKGIRNFYIVTNNQEGASEVMKLIKTSGGQRQFDFEMIEDMNWNLYKGFTKKVAEK